MQQDEQIGVRHRVTIGPLTFVGAVVAVAACWLLIHLAPVIVTIIVALFIIGTLDPAVHWLARRGLRYRAATVITFLIVLLLTAAIAAVTLPALFDQVRKLVDQEPQIRGRLADVLSRSRATSGISRELHHPEYSKLLEAGAGPILEVSGRLFSVIAYCLSAFFLALYAMLDRDRLRGGLYALVPVGYHLRLSRLVKHLARVVGGYIRGQLLTSGLMTLFVLLLLSICGVDSPLALAVFAGLTDVLPYIGGALALVPIAAAALSKGTTTVLVVVACVLAYQEFESRVIVPRIYGRALRLPSSIVLASLLAGGTLAGILGAIFALPLAAAIRVFIQQMHLDLPGDTADNASLRARDQGAERDYAARVHGLPVVQAAAIAVEICEEPAP